MKNQYWKETEEEKRVYVESFIGDAFSYIGGYIDCEHKVTIRCNKCGAVFERSMVSIRHGTATCGNCKRIEAEAKSKETQEKHKQEIAERRAERKEQTAKRKEKEAQEKEKNKEARKHPCVVCGKITTNKYCCSTSCSNKRLDGIKETKRRIKISKALIDKDITLPLLFEREKGKCYICGGDCDWDDKEIRQQTIVCGNNYPSIEHVVPLSKGGLHEWSNVRLAHRYCNSIKAANIAPLGL